MDSAPVPPSRWDGLTLLSECPELQRDPSWFNSPLGGSVKPGRRECLLDCRLEGWLPVGLVLSRTFLVRLASSWSSLEVLMGTYLFWNFTPRLVEKRKKLKKTLKYFNKCKEFWKCPGVNGLIYLNNWWRYTWRVRRPIIIYVKY